MPISWSCFSFRFSIINFWQFRRFWQFPTPPLPPVSPKCHQGVSPCPPELAERSSRGSQPQNDKTQRILRCVIKLKILSLAVSQQISSGSIAPNCWMKQYKSFWRYPIPNQCRQCKSVVNVFCFLRASARSVFIRGEILGFYPRLSAQIRGKGF